MTPERLKQSMVVVAGLTLAILGARVVGDAIASLLFPQLSGALGSASSGVSAVVIALLHAVAIAPVTIVAQARGWRLAVVISVVYWLVDWLLTVIEAVAFLSPLLPVGFTAWTAISDGLVALAVGPMAVAMLAASRLPVGEVREHPPLLDRDVTPAAWGLRLGGISIAYVVAYLAAGIFIAFRNPALQEFYEVMGMPTMSTLLSIQVGRAVLWAAAAALLLSAIDLRRRQAALLVGAVFSIIMASNALTPSPFMPPEIRPTHFVEIATSNFAFGMVAAWILSRPSRRAKARGSIN